MDTEWLSSEVSDVHQDKRMGSCIVDELILGPPSLGRTGFRAKYMLAPGSPCVPQVMLLVFTCFLPT